MATKNTFSTVYICERTAGRFGCMYVIKLMNDKIDEVLFDIKERIETRDDIDLIYKEFPSITILMKGKDFIIRISDGTIKVVSVRRSQGMAFEMVRAKMVHVDILGGVDANMYAATKNISSRHDDEYEATILPSFASLLTSEQVDAKFSARRKRKEDREKGILSSARRVPTARASVSASSPAFETPSRTKSNLDEISRRVLSMQLGSDDEDDDKRNDKSQSERENNDTPSRVNATNEPSGSDVNGEIVKTNTSGSIKGSGSEDETSDDEDDADVIKRITLSAKVEKYELKAKDWRVEQYNLKQPALFTCSYTETSKNRKKYCLERKAGSISTAQYSVYSSDEQDSLYIVLKD